MANVNFYDVLAKDGQTAAERFAGLTKDSDSFYTVGTDIYLGDQKLNNAADLATAITNIAQNAADIADINATLTKLENTESTSGSIRNIIRQYFDDLDSTATIVSKSGDVVSFYPQVSQVNGTIAAAGTQISLAAVASTGAGEDVSYDNTTSGLSATDVQGAIDTLASQAAGGVASKTIWFTDDTAGQSDYAKVYKIYQGENAPDAVTNPAALKGTINIPKDKVLKDADIVDITFSNGHLYEGATDVTEFIVRTSGTATAADAGKYLKMEMQNVDDPLYVNLQTFVDVYTVESGATEVQLDINNHEISASIVEVDGSKVIYKTETSSGAGDGETVKQALTRLDGADTVTGSVSKKIKDAIEALDTSSDVGIASKSGDIVTLKAGIKQEDGVIAQGTGSDITLAAVAITGASSDVGYVHGSIANVAGALDDLYASIGQSGSVAQQIEDAINELDTSSDVVVASTNSSTGDVTISGSIKETDGIIAKGTGTDVVLKKVSTTAKAEDLDIDDTAGYFTATNTEDALAELAERLTWREI